MFVNENSNNNYWHLNEFLKNVLTIGSTGLTNKKTQYIMYSFNSFITRQRRGLCHHWIRVRVYGPGRLILGSCMN